jgi:peptide/nickel transport system substrate-binding protein
MNRSIVVVTSCAALALTASACGGSGGENKAVKFQHGATYTEPLTSDPGNLHPLRSVQQTTNTVLPFAYDSLINIDGKGRVISQLAQRWQATPKSVTFTLKPGITCADGTKLQASDVASVFEWIKDPKHESTMIGDHLPSTDFDVKSDDAARTVTISLKQAYGFLLEGAGTVWIPCPKGLADPKSLAHATDGTGPYQLTDYAADDHLTFTIRKGYTWGPNGATTAAPGMPAKVTFKIIQNLTTQANLLLSGQLSSAALSGPDTARLKGQGFQELHTTSGPYDIFFNQRDGHPGKDPKVRQALAAALDLAQLQKVITEGSGTRPTSLAILSPQPCRVDSVKGAVPGHDLERAKALLDEAGWTAGAGGIRAKDGQKLSITLYYLSGQTPLSSGMELVSGWWKSLGVDVKLKGQDANAFTQALFQGNAWDAAALSVALPYPNEFVQYATGPASPKGQNFPAIDNAQYASLAQQALGTPGKAGCDLWAQSEQVLFRNADVVPVAADVAVTFAKTARLAIGLNGTEPTSIRMVAR